MRVATLIVATALGLGTCVTTAPAAVISGGHATSGTQFGHGGFGHHFHHKTVVFPYGYHDNDYPTDTFGDDAAMTSVAPYRISSAVAASMPAQRGNIYCPLKRRRHPADQDHKLSMNTERD